MTTAEVWIWGVRVGVVDLPRPGGIATFQYTPEFVGLRRDISPFQMPLREAPYTAPVGPSGDQTFRGLPSLLADSLPDRFGQELISAWLETQGRPGDSLNAVEELCYMGSRGMGALEFAPATGPEAAVQETTVTALLELANLVLGDRKALMASLDRQGNVGAIQSLLAMGASPAGTRPKALIAWNRTTGEVRSGQVVAERGFEHWLIKFDGVHGRSLGTPLGHGAIEYAYSLMAKAAGIDMAACDLYEENGRRHFLTRRFDRTDDGTKLHLQSLGGLWRVSHHRSGAHGYELAFRTVHRLHLPPRDLDQMLRRMAFNVIAANEDDHVRNIAFLMDRDEGWSLAPAFDLTFVHVPAGNARPGHEMTINGRTGGFDRTDLLACAENGGSMRRRKVEPLLEDVIEAVRKWPQFANEAGVPEDVAHNIGEQHLLTL